MKTRRKLREYQQFVLHRKSTDIRNELYEYIVMHVLYDHGKDCKLAYDAIDYHIKSDHDLSIPKIHLDCAIERLIENKSISKNEQFLTLEKSKIKEIEENDSEVETIRNNVFNELRKTISEKISNIPKTQVDLIIANFEELLKDTFNRYGIQAARIFTNSTEKIKELKGYSGFKEGYQKSIVQIVVEENREKLDKVLNGFFFHPSENFSKYCYGLAQNYVLIATLNVDPELTKLQKTEWGKKKIFLDTNVIIPLLFDGDELHQSTKTIIEQTRDLGASILVSTETVEEFLQWLEDNKRLHEKIVPQRNLTSALTKTEHDDTFLKTYGLEIQRISGQSIDNFCKKYENYDLLLEKFGIDLEEETISDFVKDKNAEELKERIIEHSHKKEMVATHDQKMILYTKQLRNEGKSGITGSDVWFLTNDHSLIRAERDVFGEREIPSSIISEIWMQVITPFISPTITIKDSGNTLSKLLSSNFTSYKINTEDVFNLMNVFMDDMEFTTNQLLKIIGDNFIREQLRDIKNIIDKDEELSLENVKPFVTRVQKLVTEDFKEKMDTKDKENNMRIQSFENELKDLNEKFETQINKTKKIEWRTKLIITTLSLFTGFTLLDILSFVFYFKDVTAEFLGLIALSIAVILGTPGFLSHFRKKE